MLKRLTNGEFVLALLVASLFWIAVLSWATSYSPPDPEKRACYQAAEKSGRSTEECKSLWERTTSDPIAMFTLVLAISTVGLWSATILLYFAGKKQLAHAQSESEAAEFHRTAQYEQVSEQIDALKQSADAAEEAARASTNQARASIEQATIARAALTNVNRPYVYAFNVSGFQIEPTTGDPPFLEFSIANYGETPADVDEIRASISVSLNGFPGPPEVIPFDLPIYGPRERVDGLRIRAPRSADFAGNGRYLMPQLAAGESLYFRIVVYYRGPFSEGHESSFCWQYDSDSSTMVRHGGREYNYVA